MNVTHQVALMAEIQEDERAFNLLMWKTIAEGEERHITMGNVLELFGDPRSWPEYSTGT